VERVPAKLNIMGVHVDHRGSATNAIAIDRETLFCWQPYQKPEIELFDINPAYGKGTISISPPDKKAQFSGIDEWLEYTQKLTDQRRKTNTQQDWKHKISAVPEYLRRMVFPEKEILGFRAVISGDIPPGAGLSSSSSLVVGTFDILNHINGLNISPEQMVIHCGLAEWYVGTRGGAGDHAGIKLSRRGKVVSLRSVPEIKVEGHGEFPRGYRIIIFDSGFKADKTGNAGNTFNEKVAAYEIGELYLWPFIRQKHPKLMHRLKAWRQHLKHVAKTMCLADAVENVPPQDMVEYLKSLPMKISREKLLKELPDKKEQLEALFVTHAEPREGYAVRAVMAYGISEIIRSSRVLNQLARGNISGFAEDMNTSHNGDRVKDITAEVARYKDIDDDFISVLKDDLASLSGDYHCSHPDIDDMVDIVLKAGAMSARISGAGLGGSMMALVAREQVDLVAGAMQEKYYKPRNLSIEPIVVVPVEGAGII
jgi:N-acetylgalactosamine kinase